jgi:hypothetical protein
LVNGSGQDVVNGNGGGNDRVINGHGSGRDDHNRNVGGDDHMMNKTVKTMTMTMTT